MSIAVVLEDAFFLKRDSQGCQLPDQFSLKTWESFTSLFHPEETIIVGNQTDYVDYPADLGCYFSPGFATPTELKWHLEVMGAEFHPIRNVSGVQLHDFGKCLKYPSDVNFLYHNSHAIYGIDVERELSFAELQKARKRTAWF